jgi:gliding motility-associated-like protein
MVIGGCPVVSNSVVVTAYGTPYLNIQPSAVLCHPGQQVSIQVMASPGAAVQWTSPSGFTGLMLSTAAPGVYACNVSSCGIITPLAVEVIAAPANAGLLTPGPFTLCGGDSLVLAAAPGADSYAWLPMGATGDSLIVSSGGDFALAVTNAAGCSDTSAVVHVDYIDFPIELIAAGDTVCAGQQALLLATGSGGFAWYADAALGQLLGTGPQWSAAPSQSASYWVRQEEQGCFGDTVAAFVVVNATPSPIGIDGPTFLCAGDALHLVADAPDTVLVNWSTPWGGSTGPRIDVAAAGIAQAGTYSAQASYRGCSSPVATHALQVHDPAPLELPPYTSFCEGASVTFNVPSGFTGVQWSTGAVGSSITLIASAVITVRALDPAGCPVKADLEVEAVDCPLFIPNVFSPNGDERNDTWLISGGFISAPITIYNRWGDVVYEGDMLKRGWDGRHYRNGEPCSEGVYYYVLQLNRADAGIKHHAGYVHLYQ